MRFLIRPYHPSDLCAIYRICLDNANFRDPELLGHFYAAPYAIFEPDLCFILTADGTPSGYILGTRDSMAFADRCEREWFPILRERYALPSADDQSPDANMIRRIHQGRTVNPALSDYPAHLHIDLLAAAQGQGWGRRLMETFLERLRTVDVRAVHLGVNTSNYRAVRFYEKIGFQRLIVSERSISFGMKLTPELRSQTTVCPRVSTHMERLSI
jgi:ribosomal protein S18 acetylase RimI-like enzyme